MTKLISFTELNTVFWFEAQCDQFKTAASDIRSFAFISTHVSIILLFTDKLACPNGKYACMKIKWMSLATEWSRCLDGKHCVWVGQGVGAALLCVCVCLVTICIPVFFRSTSGCTVLTHLLIHAHTCILREDTQMLGKHSHRDKHIK